MNGKSSKIIFIGLLVIGLVVGFYAIGSTQTYPPPGPVVTDNAPPVPAESAQSYPPPGPPSFGYTWAWQDAHWELISAPPSWSYYQWQQPYWNSDQGVWVSGRWIKTDSGYDESNPTFYRAPHNKAWVWIDAGWTMVPTPPSGPYEWRVGYWDAPHNRWIAGKWYRISNVSGEVWISPHWDTSVNIWIGGLWWPKEKRFNIEDYRHNYYEKHFRDQQYRGRGIPGRPLTPNLPPERNRSGLPGFKPAPNDRDQRNNPAVEEKKSGLGNIMNIFKSKKDAQPVNPDKYEQNRPGNRAVEEGKKEPFKGEGKAIKGEPKLPPQFNAPPSGAPKVKQDAPDNNFFNK